MMSTCATPPNDLIDLADAIAKARVAYLDKMTEGTRCELARLLWDNKGTFAPALRLAATAAASPAIDEAKIDQAALKAAREINNLPALGELLASAHKITQRQAHIQVIIIIAAIRALHVTERSETP